MPKCKRSPASSLKLISPRGSKPRAQPHAMDMPGIDMPGMEMPEMKMPQGHDMKREDSDAGKPGWKPTGALPMPMGEQPGAHDPATVRTSVGKDRRVSRRVHPGGPRPL